MGEEASLFRQTGLSRAITIVRLSDADILRIDDLDGIWCTRVRARAGGGSNVKHC